MDRGTVWAHGWRTVVVVVGLLVAGLATFLSGLGGRPFGILWTGLALGAGAGAVVWLLWWRRPGRGPALGVAVVAAALLGVAIGVRTPPGPVVLGGAIEALDLPDGEQVDASSGGNVLCFDVCPTARRTYLVDAPPAQVAEQVRDALRDAGYTLDDPVDAVSFTTDLDGTREWYVAGRAEPAPGGAGTELHLRATAAG